MISLQRNMGWQFYKKKKKILKNWLDKVMGDISYYDTVVSPRLIGQFGPILLRKTSDSAHFFLVRSYRENENCSGSDNTPKKV